MRRLQIILSSMVETAIRAAVEGRTSLAEEVLHMEEEADRIYWMVIRQLLLAVIDRRGAEEGGIERAMHLVGNKGTAKNIEQKGGLASFISPESLEIQNDGPNEG